MDHSRTHSRTPMSAADLLNTLEQVRARLSNLPPVQPGPARELAKSLRVADQIEILSDLLAPEVCRTVVATIADPSNAPIERFEAIWSEIVRLAGSEAGTVQDLWTSLEEVDRDGSTAYRRQIEGDRARRVRGIRDNVARARANVEAPARDVVDRMMQHWAKDHTFELHTLSLADLAELNKKGGA